MRSSGGETVDPRIGTRQGGYGVTQLRVLRPEGRPLPPTVPFPRGRL